MNFLQTGMYLLKMRSKHEDGSYIIKLVYWVGGNWALSGDRHVAALVHRRSQTSARGDRRRPHIKFRPRECFIITSWSTARLIITNVKTNSNQFMVFVENNNRFWKVNTPPNRTRKHKTPHVNSSHCALSPEHFRLLHDNPCIRTCLSCTLT